MLWFRKNKKNYEPLNGEQVTNVAYPLSFGIVSIIGVSPLKSLSENNEEPVAPVELVVDVLFSPVKAEHMQLYGEGNENRMLGSHETSSYDKFKRKPWCGSILCPT